MNNPLNIISGHNLSFDHGVAISCGINAAIIYNHIIYWLKVNKDKPECMHDGRVWMYQSQERMADFFELFELREVKYCIKKLVDVGLLEKKNFNKNPFDHTNWYSLPEPIFQKVFPIVQKCTDRSTKNVPIEGAPVVPSDGAQIVPSSISKKERKDKEYKERSQAPLSADAHSLTQFLFDSLKKRSPSFKEPNLTKWGHDMDKLLRIDKRSVEEIKRLIVFSSTHKFYKIAILSPAALRKHYDGLVIANQAAQEQDLVNLNRSTALKVREQYPEKLKALSFTDKYITNSSLGKDVSFSLPHEEFKRAFAALFGGRYD